MVESSIACRAGCSMHTVGYVTPHRQTECYTDSYEEGIDPIGVEMAILDRLVWYCYISRCVGVLHCNRVV